MTAALPEVDDCHPEWIVFWAMWPHRVDKKLAQRAFKKARKRASMDEIMEGLDQYIRNKPDWQQWKGPAAWLNGDRWEDKYESSRISSRYGPKSDQALAQIADHVKRPWCEIGAYSREVLEQCVAEDLLTKDEMEAKL